MYKFLHRVSYYNSILSPAIFFKTQQHCRDLSMPMKTVILSTVFLLVGYAAVTTPPVQCLITTNIYFLGTWHACGWGSPAMALLHMMSAEGKVG